MALFGSQLVVTYPRPQAQAQAVPAGNQGGGGATRTANLDFKNILTLVPAEAVAPFLAAKPAVPSGLETRVWVWIAFGICLLICVALRMKATQPPGATGLHGVNWPLVFVSAVAFFIWAQATTEDGVMVPVFHGSFAGLVAIAYGLIVPAFVPAVPRP
jgi:hypothetical protein